MADLYEVVQVFKLENADGDEVQQTLTRKWTEQEDGSYVPDTGATISGTVAATFSGDLPDTADDDLAAIAAALAGVLTAVLSGDLPDTAPGDLAAIAAALAGTLDADVTVANEAASGAYVRPGTSTVWDVSDRGARQAGVVTVSPATAIVHGKTVVAAAGTEVPLGSSTPLTYGVRIKALAGNTNNVYVGANPVTSLTGFVLDAGEEVFLEVANLATVFVDVDTNGEGVTYIGG